VPRENNVFGLYNWEKDTIRGAYGHPPWDEDLARKGVARLKEEYCE
jgi:hypothetical protein